MREKDRLAYAMKPALTIASAKQCLMPIMVCVMVSTTMTTVSMIVAIAVSRKPSVRIALGTTASAIAQDCPIVLTPIWVVTTIT